MKTVAELCKPRPSVFDDTTTDDVLDITNLLNGTIDENRFFAENFRTRGMSLLFDIAFERFQGKSETGVIKLTQAMGGGKTHNMLALALLARNPVLREKILGKKYTAAGAVKVIAFTGRESDAKFGIWGALAEQMGRKELFKDLYSPLQAPGQSAWVHLFKGEKVLILLDELPPYLENARAIQIGDSNLSKVTVTALANLFNAMGQADMKNVLLVFSDLKATYQSGSEQLHASFANLENEANRMARDIAPVAINTDEVYDILKARLFSHVPERSSQDVRDVANAYREAATDAAKAGYVNVNKGNTTIADALAAGIIDAYPFHPSIKDLYARFKENPNFQQTRGLIRLMRQIVRQFYESKTAERQSLINAYDVDLNNQRLLTFVREIKPELENAVSYDIAQGGRSIAEQIDAEAGTACAQTFSKLLLMASLNSTINGVNGLSERDAFGYLTAPGADLGAFRTAFEEMRARAWYLKCDTAGRYLFQQTKSMVAEISSLVDSYSDEAAKKELKKVLQENFAPKFKNCYETIVLLPALDEIRLEMNRTALVVCEPYAGGGLHPDLKTFYDNAVFKNRVLFLTGARKTMETLLENSKRRTAIASVIDTMRQSSNFTETDPQYKEASVLLDKYTHALFSTFRETFVTLFYPAKGDALMQEPFDLKFENNHFEGERQVVQALENARKFEEFTNDPKKLETLRLKCEQRLFTQQEMKWETILDRAASTTSWPLLHPSQMNSLRDHCTRTDKWREIGGYLRKGPFPKEPTAVQVEQVGFDEKTGEFTLKVHGVNATAVFYEIGAPASSASARVQGGVLKTKETELFFVAIDENPKTDELHPTGEGLRFLCKVPLKHRQRTTPSGETLELKSHPTFEIRYTTDGSNPKEDGGVYTGEIVLPKDCTLVLAAVYSHGTLVEEKSIEVAKGSAKKTVEVDPAKPLSITFGTRVKLTDTASVYKEIDLLESYSGLALADVTATIFDKADSESYAETSVSKAKVLPSRLRALLDASRDGMFAGVDINLNLGYKRLHFATGADFLRYVEVKKLDLGELAETGRFEQ